MCKVRAAKGNRAAKSQDFMFNDQDWENRLIIGHLNGIFV